MKYLLATLAACKLAASHSSFQSFALDGVDQGQHFAVRTTPNHNNPILDPNSSDMICNGGIAANDTLAVDAGSKITMQWHHNDPAIMTGDKSEPIAPSHKGPVMVYIAPTSSEGKGDVWVKLYEDGYNGSKWGVDNFIINKGAITITLPDLVDGEYLVRPEIIALHQANVTGGAQFFSGCGQIKVTGGSTPLPSGVDITTAYSPRDPGILCDIHSGLTSYKIPGPAVWDAAGRNNTTLPSNTVALNATLTSTSKAAPDTAISTHHISTPASCVAPTPNGINAGNTYHSPKKSSSQLPETFTIKEFVAWFEKVTRMT